MHGTCGDSSARDALLRKLVYNKSKTKRNKISNTIK